MLTHYIFSRNSDFSDPIFQDAVVDQIHQWIDDHYGCAPSKGDIDDAAWVSPGRIQINVPDGAGGDSEYEFYIKPV